MKKWLLVSLALFAVLGGAFAQERSPFVLQVGGGIYYNAEPAPTAGTGDLDSFINILAALLNVRGEAFVNFGFRLTDGLSAGVELGLAGMSLTDNTTGASVSLFDLPAGLVLTYGADGNTGISAIGGVMARGVLAAESSCHFYAYGGGRLSLGGLYGEATYNLPLDASHSAYWRYGLGYLVRL
jgi:hypothetical protein